MQGEWYERSRATAAAFIFAALTSAAQGEEPPRDGGARMEVASLEVSPGVLPLRVGQTRQLAATVRAPDRTPLPGRRVRWSSSDAEVATVTQWGFVVARSPGVTTITAASEGRSGRSTIHVAPPLG